MQSKFTSLVKYKKSEVDKKEHAIMEMRAKIDHKEQTIAKLNEELLTFGVGLTSGTFSAFAQQGMIKSAFRRQINFHTVERDNLKQHLVQLQNDLKLAHLEYEKFKYLETKEKQEQIKKMKRKESLFLDEVAIIGYNAQQG
jgi:flagellar export protein FliJ